ncbi:SpoIIE family protein phosphatase [Streptomyces sp. N2-109]|uniref:SpoIIE family protein phosphatase n=1 Tax=Streptomyces gossypii TaxID=2883101 RepID=A0ABT2K2Q8_9ACTN|nr:SpoIIE family protein phosphatase [Streptomyces gossypii]MCT2594447.1 SpoIIE family protein phosphatase [Streptomyces gossypii]
MDLPVAKPPATSGPLPDDALSGVGRETAGAGAAVRLLAYTETSALLNELLDDCLATLRSTHGAIYLVQDDGRLRLATGRGYSEEQFEQMRSISAEAELPTACPFRERRPVFGTADQYDGGYPEIEAFRPDVGFAGWPLMIDGSCLGTVLIRTGPRAPDDAERSLLDLLTGVGAHRLEHLLAHGEPVSGATNPQLGQTVRMIEDRSRAARLQLAIAGADIGFFDWDFASGRVVCDEKLCQMFGFDPQLYDEQIESFFAALSPDDRERVEKAVEAGIRSGDFDVSYRIAHPDHVVWVRAKGRVFTNHRGEPSGIVGVVQDHTQEHLRESREAARRDFIRAVTRGIMGALSTQEVVDTAAEAVLPALGARRLILYVREGRWLEFAAAHGYSAEALAALEEGAQLAHEDQRLWDAILTKPVFLPTRQAYREYLGDAFPPLPGQHAWAILPLDSGEGRLGVCAISFSEPHVFTEDDKTLCVAAAGVLAQALGRARVLDQRRRQLTELQRMMLPRRVPELPEVDIAVRYLPSSEGLEVGGDWYDVVPAPHGRVMLVIGDVQGHSAKAAAVMGHLRVAMQAYAAEGVGPGALLHRAGRILADLDTERFATCLVIEVTLSTGLLRAGRAGHFPPLLREPGGGVRELQIPGGLPLGSFADNYPVAEHRLAPGATLLLYTDGLVERPGEDIGDAVHALSRRFYRLTDERHPHTSALAPLADALMAPASRHALDDIALLLLRRRDQ